MTTDSLDHDNAVARVQALARAIISECAVVTSSRLAKIEAALAAILGPDARKEAKHAKHMSREEYAAAKSELFRNARGSK